MSFDIRSGLQRPNKGRQPTIDYPFATLQVGQCIVVNKGQQSNVWKKARAFMDAHPGWQLHGGTFTENGTRKYGVWCIERPARDGEPAPARVAPLTRFADQQPAESPMAQRLREAAKLTKAGVARTVTHK